MARPPLNDVAQAKMLQEKLCPKLEQHGLGPVTLRYRAGVFSIADMPCQQLSLAPQRLGLGYAPLKAGYRFRSPFDQAAFVARELDGAGYGARIRRGEFRDVLQEIIDYTPRDGEKFFRTEIGPGRTVSDIDSDLEADGTLSFVIRTVSKEGVRGPIRGQELFADMMKFHGTSVKTIEGVWSYESNLAMFQKSISDQIADAQRASKPLTAQLIATIEQNAALATWTGTQAKAAGFSTVSRVSVTRSPAGEITGVIAQFTKSES